MNDRPSLRADGLDEVWARVTDRLERQGLDNRGRVTLPELSSRARLTLTSLLDRAPAKTIDLAALEQALQRLGLGVDLAEAMAELGHPVPGEIARRRAVRAQAAVTRDRARAAVTAWPEPWVSAWIDEIILTGTFANTDPAEAETFLAHARLVLDELDYSTELPSQWNAYVPYSRLFPEPLARVDLAARLLGSAHALDRGTRLEAALSRALARAFDASADAPSPTDRDRSTHPDHTDPSLGASADAADPTSPAGLVAAAETEADGASVDQLDRHQLWERAGVHLDLTSAPALTWALPVDADSDLASLTTPARDLGTPLHLSQFVLRKHPAQVAAGTVVMVVENPRIVEAAAQAASADAFVATNGNPSGAVRLLLDQLLASGADLRYHGDFDTPGLAICARMADLGLRPWRMDAKDYATALAQADADGVELPVEANPPGPTSWDPALRELFGRERRVVHEERLLPDLLHV